MDGWWQDAKLALRTLRRRPVWAFSIVAVLSIGLAGNAAMFAAFDAWVIRPLDLESPQELVDLRSVQPRLGGDGEALSAPDWRDVVQRQSLFRSAAAYSRATFNLDDEVEASRVEGARIEWSLLPALGIHPVLGRPLEERDDLPGRPAPVALIGDRLWRERYGADPEVLGRVIRIDGAAHEIVGVMPPDFEFPEWAQVWTPLGLDPDASARDRRWLPVVARLAPGVSLAAARAELEQIGDELAAEHPLTNTGWTLSARPLREVWVPDVIEVAITASLGSAVLVLLVICANVGSLFLADLEPRSRELALRVALGAGRLRTVRPFLLQSVLLSAVGGAAGCVLGAVWLNGMLGRVPVDPPYLFAMRLDSRTLTFTAASALLAGLACAAMPLIRRRPESPASALRSSGGSAAGSARLRALLVAAELALTTALLIGALLMTRSFLEQRTEDPGYRRSGVVTAELSLAGPAHDEVQERIRFVERLLDGVRRSARVRSAGLATLRPADGCLRERFEAEGAPAERGEGVGACVVGVAGDYLETLAVPPVAGRLLTDAEWREGGDGVVISSGLAERLWPDGAAVGRRLRTVGEPAPGGDGAGWRRVVGVVGDVSAPRDMVVDAGNPGVQLYLPYAEHSGRRLAVVVGTGAPGHGAVGNGALPGEIAGVLRAAMRRAGASVPLGEVLSLERSVANAQWVSRFFSEQLVLYAAAALTIAVFGLYGLVSDSVTRSRFELAMRLALGARRHQVLALVARRGAWMVGGGIVTGVVLGLAMSRLGAAMLGGASFADLPIYVLVVGVLALAAALATWLPARRAARLDPARLLRSE